MRKNLTIAAATAALAAVGVAATGAGATAPSPVSAAATRHAEGRVIAIDRSKRAFTVRDAERGTLKVRVTSTTKFERVSFSGLRAGQRVDVRATRVGSAWNATKVERGSAAASNHDAGDDHGDDHGGGHGGGSDDRAGHH
jgi:hypothetical protein